MPKLPPNQQLVRAPLWPIVGERGPRMDAAPWSLTVAGEVASPTRFTWDDLRRFTSVERLVDVHCVTRWSRLGMRFRGFLFVELLLRVSPLATAKFVSFVARSARDHSTSLPLAELLTCEPLIVWEAEGAPLTTEHGGPLRMVVPGKYFYKSVKWLDRIEFLAEDRLGYWEADAGYHNGADPWREERYFASTLSKQEASALLAAKDFSQRDLRGINGAGRELSELHAARSLLRDADFRGANLRHADFQGANLSNAHLEDAILVNANLAGTDLEGADLSGADLSGANLLGASLFGATFVTIDPAGIPRKGARFDRETRIANRSLEALTEEQRAYILPLISLIKE